MLGFPSGADGRAVDRGRPRRPRQGATTGRQWRAAGGFAAVSNVGDDAFWTGHPLAQANLYAFGRLALGPDARPGRDPRRVDRPDVPGGDPTPSAPAVHAVLDDSWRTYEQYTAPLGVGFMVRPGHHYGPDVDGYEYTPWGTYHFADRDGIGVDRTRAHRHRVHRPVPAAVVGDVYESLSTCPDELLLFFHHVPYTHVLHSGTTVIQHIYDTHFDGVREVERDAAARGHARRRPGARRRLRPGRASGSPSSCAAPREWRDQVNTYFFRKSGIPDATGRTIY